MKSPFPLLHLPINQTLGERNQEMPSVAVKLYSVYFKLLLKHKLQSQIHSSSSSSSFDPFGITSRADEPSSPSNPSFSSADAVATKDIHIDPLTALSVRIFLPSSVLTSPNPSSAAYRGYLPDPTTSHRRLPIILQFHGGAFVSGSNVSAANDLFCRRIAKVMDVIVVAVGYRLAPESRHPAAFEDGVKALGWVGKQANLAECRRWSGGGGKGEVRRRVVDAFGASSVEPWIAAHGDPARYGGSCYDLYCFDVQ